MSISTSCRKYAGCIKKKKKDTLAKCHVWHCWTRVGWGDLAGCMDEACPLSFPSVCPVKKLTFPIKGGDTPYGLWYLAHTKEFWEIVVPASTNIQKSSAKVLRVCVSMTLLLSLSLQSQRACKCPPNLPCSLKPPWLCPALPVMRYALPCSPCLDIPVLIPPILEDQVHTSTSEDFLNHKTDSWFSHLFPSDNLSQPHPLHYSHLVHVHSVIRLLCSNAQYQI